MEAAVKVFVSLVDSIKLTLLMALILVNFITGLAVAFKTGTFNLKAMGGFLYSRVVPFVLAYLAMGIVATVDSDWAWAVTATWGVIILALGGAILQNLKELGIKVPDLLSGGSNAPPGG